MKILVTGASGFLGRRIVEIGISQGNTMIGLGSPRSGSGHPSIDVSRIDSFSALEPFGPFDAAIHAAAIAHRRVSDREYHDVNAIGSGNVAAFAASCEASTFVHISSVAVYGNQERTDAECISESDRCLPTDTYARSKLEAEKIVAKVCEENNMRLVTLRPGPIIGEGCKGNFPRLVTALRRGRFVWIGKGTNKKSLVYIDDVAGLALSAAGDQNLEGIYNAAATPIELKTIVDAITQEIGVKVPSINIPASAAKVVAALASRIPVSAAKRFSRNIGTWLAEDLYCTDRIRNAGPYLTTDILEAVRRTARDTVSRR